MLTDDEANSSLRITISDNMTMDDVDEVVDKIKKAIDMEKTI